MGKVSVQELKRGMIVDRDIFSRNGALLLYKGFKIENPDLVSIVLRRNKILEIIIKDEPTSDYAFIKESSDISRRIKNEVASFKEEFKKIVEDFEEDVNEFISTNDIKNIRSLDQASNIAKQHEHSVLTLFQMIEKIKKESVNDFSNIIQCSLISYSIGKWVRFNDQELKELSQVAILSGIFSLANINYKNKHKIIGEESVPKRVFEASFLTKERIDGSGPMGLRNKEIPIYSKIVAIAEVFHSLTSNNELFQNISVFDAIKIMKIEYINLLDTKILYIFLHKISSKYIGSTLRLKDGTEGVIVFVPESECTLPFIKTSDDRVINLQNEAYKNNRIVEIL